MRMLVIAPQPFFSPRGTPFSVYYRTLVAAELGARIDVLTYGEGDDVDIPGVRIIRVPRFRVFGRVKIGPSLLKLFLDGCLVLWMLALLVRNRYDVVHAHEESVFFCRFLKPIFGFKLIYDMHSSLPQQLRNFEFTSSAVLIRLFERLEEQSLRKADVVITICPELARYAVARVPDPERHFLIENSIFERVRLGRGVSANGAAQAVPSLPAGRAIVAYAGTFEPYQGLDLLLEAFSIVQRTRPDAYLLMIGGSPSQVDVFRALADGLGLSGHCLFTGRLDQELTRRLLERAAVLTSPRRHGNNTPLKIYEQLASGIPLVATRILAHTQVLDESVCFLVDPEPKSMAEGILAALTDEERRRASVAAAKRLYEREYARPVYVDKVRRVLEAVR